MEEQNREKDKKEGFSKEKFLQVSEPPISEKEKTELLKQSEISLILDTYDDIFSDFDPRPYSERALSDDFLIEAKKAMKDKPSGIVELKFLIPTHERDLINEVLIKKRLREHFKKHINLIGNERKKARKKGAILAFVGMILMFLASFIILKYSDKQLLFSFLITLLEPASWFLFWEGLNYAIFESRSLNPDLEFYKRMSKCEISFRAY
jgi:hypothetical protein